MTKVVDKYIQHPERPLFICDFSPPRGSHPGLLEPSKGLDVDFISVAYNPGKSVRINSAFAAHWIKANTGADVVFTIATRDMNKVAVQSLLMGAELLGLENVVVVMGDSFTNRELSLVKDVKDYSPTGLIRSIGQMNEGIDYRGRKLRSPTSLCVGATIDLGRDMDRELRLTHSKVDSGAHFFISQPTFQAGAPREFIERYAEQFGEELSVPIFHGIQIMTRDSLVLSSVPQWVNDDLEKGRKSEDIALEVLSEFTSAGFRSFYLVPPILRGGRRDYQAARSVLEAVPR